VLVTRKVRKLFSKKEETLGTCFLRRKKHLATVFYREEEIPGNCFLRMKKH
jgi:hypothetical protein